MKKILILTVILMLTFALSSHAKSVDYNDPRVSKEVNTLRKFRDFHLKKSKAGMEFVKYYYKYGPIAAKAIKKRDRLRSLVRLSLLPLMYAGKNFNLVMSIIKLFGIFLAGITVWFIYIRIKHPLNNGNRIKIIYS